MRPPIAHEITRRVILEIPSRQLVPVRIGRKFAVPKKTINKPRTWSRQHVNLRLMGSLIYPIT